jgi:hypothetical protein
MLVEIREICFGGVLGGDDGVCFLGREANLFPDLNL